jgi:hypothetical protein
MAVRKHNRARRDRTKMAVTGTLRLGSDWAPSPRQQDGFARRTDLAAHEAEIAVAGVCALQASVGQVALDGAVADQFDLVITALDGDELRVRFEDGSRGPTALTPQHLARPTFARPQSTVGFSALIAAAHVHGRDGVARLAGALAPDGRLEARIVLVERLPNGGLGDGCVFECFLREAGDERGRADGYRSLMAWQADRRKQVCAALGMMLGAATS